MLAAALATSGLPAVPAAPPAPEAVLGFPPCADRKVATYEQIAEYLRSLDAASDRVRLFDIGRTVEGRTQLLAAISSAGNLERLDRFKNIARRLALARDLSDATARALAREGRAIVWIDFGLHSSELAHGQVAPLLAWRVAIEDSAEMEAIRDNVILVLVPSMNPDGATQWADWYASRAGTPYERAAPPVLYHRYVGHDNNRDWFMFNMPESRNVARQLYFEWYPQIVYDHHQEAPFPARIVIPPFDDPKNPNIPPLVMSGIAAIGDAMGRRLAQEGKTGAISRLGYDTWWNGGMRTTPCFHNMVGVLTETAHSSPAPARYDPARFPPTFANGVPTLEPSTSYPSPYRGGAWRFRDSCDYMISTSLATLDIGAKRRVEWLYDMYRMGRDAIRAGAQETYVVPAEQWDRGAASGMIDVLRLGAVDVERTLSPFSAGGSRYAAGSFLIRGGQAFRPYLTDLLNPQVYPDRRSTAGTPARAYDMTGWTLPYQMGVRVDRISERVEAPTEAVSTAGPPSVGIPAATAPAYAIDPRANAAFTLVNRLLASGDRVRRAAAEVPTNGGTWPPGTFVVEAHGGTHGRLARSARDLGVPVAALDRAPAAETPPLSQPRIGLYHAWGGNMDEGWTRWLLERFEFPYALVHDGDLRAGGLHERFDVIILPDAPYDAMLKGLAPGTLPPEYVGGMTTAGVSNLYAFVETGGCLVALDTATQLPLSAFGLRVNDVTAGRRTNELYAPGSLLRIAVDPTHPVAYGMPREAAAVFTGSHAFDVGLPRPRSEVHPGEDPRPVPGVRVVATYAERDLLMSGWLIGEPFLAGRAAVVEATLGRGRVVLLGFRVQHRGQPLGTFKLLFNALHLGSVPRDASPATLDSRPATARR